ncbi:MFS transporter [Reichenbachiella versicolor]|uniref:MFS transporter n=1 Tax=Reichenbachiella versicolor TaxID=1821036 RepID=UPI000D6E4BE0|nr:MFS transporter [Reichenbachiella versicolor]
MKLPTRHIVVSGMFILSLLLYVDRVCISVAKETIQADLGLSDIYMGWVLSAFALGYALFQVPSGMLSDEFGPRKVLASIVSVWSVFTAMTGFAWNYLSLIFTRFLFGAGEAGAFPGMSRAIFSWIPLKERGLVLGLNFSGSRLGAAFALPFVAWLISEFGWRTSFYILGVIGVVWAVIWWFVFRDDPEKHPFISEEEKKHILLNRQQPETTKKEKLIIGTLLKSSNMKIAIIQYFCSNFTFYFALTWLFPYLKETYSLNSLEAGWYSIAPFVAGAGGNWIAGILIDRIYAAGKWNLSRKLPAIIGFSLAAIGLIGSIFMKTPITAVIMLSIAILGADMTLPPSWALCVDIGKSNAGTASGAMNMAGNIGSFLTALAFPYLTAWTGTVDYFFYTAAGLNIIAVVIWSRTKAKAGLAY